MTLTKDHPALVLLADTLAATRGPHRPDDIAKLLGHALEATGYELVPKRSDGNVVANAPVQVMAGWMLNAEGGCGDCGQKFPHRGTCKRSVMRSGVAWIPPDMAEDGV